MCADEAPERRWHSVPVMRVVKCVVEMATVGAGAATLGALGAAQAWPLELLSHFRVQYAVALTILAGALLMLRARTWAAAAVILLAVNAWVVAPFVLPIGARVDCAIDAGAPSLKLASINVYSGNPTPQRVLEYIDATDPDVVVLLEVTPEWEQRLTALAARYPHSAVQSRAGNFGIALFSRHPLHGLEYVPLSRDNDAISAGIELGDGRVHVVAAHPFPPAGGRGAELRNRQLRELAVHVAQLGRPCVVAGDLNITPFSPYFDSFLAAGGLRDPRRGQGVLPTWPSQRWPLWIPIDHCVVSAGIAARITVGPDVGSDHRPLLAELQMAGAPKNRAHAPVTGRAGGAWRRRTPRASPGGAMQPVTAPATDQMHDAFQGVPVEEFESILAHERILDAANHIDQIADRKSLRDVARSQFGDDVLAEGWRLGFCGACGRTGSGRRGAGGNRCQELYEVPIIERDLSNARHASSYGAGHSGQIGDRGQQDPEHAGLLRKQFAEQDDAVGIRQIFTEQTDCVAVLPRQVTRLLGVIGDIKRVP